MDVSVALTEKLLNYKMSSWSLFAHNCHPSLSLRTKSTILTTISLIPSQNTEDISYVKFQEPDVKS